MDGLNRRRREVVALVLQGGGALGSYQGGVYQELAKAGFLPDWVAGISIGAINGALIAGNPRDKVVERLHAFWSLVSSASSPAPFAPEMFPFMGGGMAAASTLFYGAPGFFSPRVVPPYAQPKGQIGALSFYDSSELRSTLSRFVDFDRINDGPVRLSVGAVNIRTGNFVYFDSAKMRLAPEHIMASGALPPGLPPIEIDGEYYWDGGLVSNTPLQYVIDEDGPDDLLAFQVDLFSSRGEVPDDIFEAAEREKDIRYSSRTRLNTDVTRRRQELAGAAERLRDRLPAEFHDDPDLRMLLEQSCSRAISLVHLIYKAKRTDTYAKDYEFSRPSILAHWAAGREDATSTLTHPDFANRGVPERSAIRVYDLNDPEAERAAAALARAQAEADES
jgi:NTE family protein